MTGERNGEVQIQEGVGGFVGKGRRFWMRFRKASALRKDCQLQTLGVLVNFGIFPVFLFCQFFHFLMIVLFCDVVCDFVSFNTISGTLAFLYLVSINPLSNNQSLSHKLVLSAQRPSPLMVKMSIHRSTHKLQNFEWAYPWKTVGKMLPGEDTKIKGERGHNKSTTYLCLDRWNEVVKRL